MDRMLNDKPSLRARAFYQVQRITSQFSSNLSDVSWSENSSRTSLSSVVSTDTDATSINDENQSISIEDIFVLKTDASTAYTFTNGQRLFHRDLHNDLNECLGGHVYLSRLRFAGKDTSTFRPSVLIITKSANTKLALAQYFRTGPPILKRMAVNKIDIHIVLNSFGLAGSADDMVASSLVSDLQASFRFDSTKDFRSGIMTVSDRGEHHSTTFLAGLKVLLGSDMTFVSVFHPLTIFDNNQKHWQEALSGMSDSIGCERQHGAVSIYFDDVYDRSSSVKVQGVAGAIESSPSVSNGFEHRITPRSGSYGMRAGKMSASQLTNNSYDTKKCHNFPVINSDLPSTSDLNQLKMCSVGDKRSVAPCPVSASQSLQARLVSCNSDVDWSVWQVQARNPDQLSLLHEPNEANGYVVEEFFGDDIQNTVDVAVALPEGSVSGRMQPDVVFFQIGQKQLQLQVITLESPLTRGCSGALVTHKNQACGMVVAVEDYTAEAYILTFDKIVGDIERVAGRTVRLPLATGQENGNLPSKNVTSTDHVHTPSSVKWLANTDMSHDTAPTRPKNNDDDEALFCPSGYLETGSSQLEFENVRKQRPTCNIVSHSQRRDERPAVQTNSLCQIQSSEAKKDIVVVVMGTTGVGKSSFIQKICSTFDTSSHGHDDDLELPGNGSDLDETLILDCCCESHPVRQIRSHSSLRCIAGPCIATQALHYGKGVRYVNSGPSEKPHNHMHYSCEARKGWLSKGIKRLKKQTVQSRTEEHCSSESLDDNHEDRASCVSATTKMSPSIRQPSVERITESDTESISPQYFKCPPLTFGYSMGLAKIAIILSLLSPALYYRSQANFQAICYKELDPDLEQWIHSYVKNASNFLLPALILGFNAVSDRAIQVKYRVKATTMIQCVGDPIDTFISCFYAFSRWRYLMFLVPPAHEHVSTTDEERMRAFARTMLDMTPGDCAEEVPVAPGIFRYYLLLLYRLIGTDRSRYLGDASTLWPHLRVIMIAMESLLTMATWKVTAETKVESGLYTIRFLDGCETWCEHDIARIYDQRSLDRLWRLARSRPGMETEIWTLDNWSQTGRETECVSTRKAEEEDGNDGIALTVRDSFDSSTRTTICEHSDIGGHRTSTSDTISIISDTVDEHKSPLQPVEREDDVPRSALQIVESRTKSKMRRLKHRFQKLMPLHMFKSQKTKGTKLRDQEQVLEPQRSYGKGKGVR